MQSPQYSRNPSSHNLHVQCDQLIREKMIPLVAHDTNITQSV